MSKPVALAITTLTLSKDPFKVGVAGSVTIAIKGGTAPYRVISNDLPPGFSLSGPVLSWLPTVADAFGFTLTAIDKKGAADNQGYKVIIAPADPVVVAPPPSPPVTSPPAPAVITDPAFSTDPDRRQAYDLGRGENYDRQMANKGGDGLNLIKVKDYPNDLPKGSSILNGYALYLEGPPTLSGPFDLSRYDTSGFQVYWRQPFPVQMFGGKIGTNPDWAFNPVHYEGEWTADARMLLKDVTIDQWSNVATPFRQLDLWLPPNVDGENLRFVNTAQSAAHFGPGSKVNLRNVYFESAGQNAYRRRDAAGNLLADDGSNDHPETFRHTGGEVVIDGFMGDYRTKPFAGTGAGLHQWRDPPGTNPPGQAIYRNGFMLMGSGDMIYAIQLAYGSSYPGKTRLENIAWRQANTSKDHPGNNQVIDDQNNERLFGSGNINFDTGELLPGRINTAV